MEQWDRNLKTLIGLEVILKPECDVEIVGYEFFQTGSCSCHDSFEYFDHHTVLLAICVMDVAIEDTRICALMYLHNVD